jgi:hypothetical protein
MKVLYASCHDLPVEAFVDDEDYERLSSRTWYLTGNGYVMAYVKGSGRRSKRYVTLHRDVLLYAGANDIDHINRNKLDNRKSNLRIVSRSSNLRNTGIRKDNTSGSKGVSWHKSCSRWFSYAWHSSKRINLGYYKDIDDAVLARERHSSSCPICKLPPGLEIIQ